jgi:hypothetical protein
MHNHYPGKRRGQCCGDAMRCDHHALRHVESPRPAHEVGNDNRKDRPVDPGADAIEKLGTHEPGGVVGKRIEAAADCEDGEPGEEQWLAAPEIGPRADHQRNRY